MMVLADACDCHVDRGESVPRSDLAAWETLTAAGQGSGVALAGPPPHPRQGGQDGYIEMDTVLIE